MKTRRRLFLKILGAILAVGLLYILASGPLYRTTAKSSGHDWILWKCVDTLYRPLFAAAGETHLHQPMLTYLRRWGVPTYLGIVDLGSGAQSIQIRALPPSPAAHQRVDPPGLPPSTPAPPATPMP